MNGEDTGILVTEKTYTKLQRVIKNAADIWLHDTTKEKK